MVTFRDVEKVLAWTKANNARVVIIFRRYPYSVVIDKFIRASERGGGFVEWYKAFGPRPPHIVLSSMKIEKIIVKAGSREETLENLGELLKRIQG